MTPTYAIIDDNGNQRKVRAGDVVRIDQPFTETGGEITFGRVLLVGSDEGAKVGAPAVEGASVTGEVVRAIKGEKLTIQKYKRRKGYHLKQGHRQKYTEVKITAIHA
jgi:large subunit ribosomal protein L21